jgi:hypothetical protein
MADATLATIEAALFARLQTRLATASPAGPFATVDRLAVDNGSTLDVRSTLAPLGVVPAALLAFEGETYAPEATTLNRHVTSWVGRSTWRILVIASDLRGDPTAATAATTGLYALVSDVTAALAGLPIADTWHRHRAMLLDTRPLSVARGQYVYQVRLAVERALESVPFAAVTQALLGIDGDVNQQGTADAATNPLVEFDASTT